ncbi:MAG: type II toxin-antitoxin system VapC family toxin [Verrucomicrobiae bacterium]|nr:type II toxin-antitoxin system VapC family toxin [Verrucomicrobiae bacterium]
MTTGNDPPVYCDSAILVKLVCHEPDSAFFERELTGQPLRSCDLARAEVFAALRAKERSGQIAAGDVERAWRQFMDWVDEETVLLDPLDARVLDRAMHSIRRCHPQVAVRTLDAIHVAACDLGNEFPLVATDVRLRAAARRMDIPVFPERLPNELF